MHVFKHVVLACYISIGSTLSCYISIGSMAPWAVQVENGPGGTRTNWSTHTSLKAAQEERWRILKEWEQVLTKSEYDLACVLVWPRPI